MGKAVSCQCPPFLEVARGIERGDPKFLEHAAACPRCLNELKLYREFVSEGGTASDADVQWVARRLSDTQRDA